MTTAAICATREVLWNPSFYSGEQYDPDLGLYYLRARYYNPATGRFLSRDPEDGKPRIPATLHKYLYAGGDPVNSIDPRGREDMFEYAAKTEQSVGEVLRFSGVVLCVAGLEWYAIDALKGMDMADTVVGGGLLFAGCVTAVLAYTF